MIHFDLIFVKDHLLFRDLRQLLHAFCPGFIVAFGGIDRIEFVSPYFSEPFMSINILL